MVCNWRWFVKNLRPLTFSCDLEKTGQRKHKWHTVIVERVFEVIALFAILIEESVHQNDGDSVTFYVIIRNRLFRLDHTDQPLKVIFKNEMNPATRRYCYRCIPLTYQRPFTIF